MMTATTVLLYGGSASGQRYSSLLHRSVILDLMNSPGIFIHHLPDGPHYIICIQPMPVGKMHISIQMENVCHPIAEVSTILPAAVLLYSLLRATKFPHKRVADKQPVKRRPDWVRISKDSPVPAEKAD